MAQGNGEEKMTINTVYVIPLGKGKIEFALRENNRVVVAVSDEGVTLTATFPLAEFMEISSNLEMDSVPEGDKQAREYFSKGEKK